MFDGPGHFANPSSVSRMSLGQRRRGSDAWSRTSRSRRPSEDEGDGVSRPRSRSKASYGSVDFGNEHSSPGEDSGEPESHGMSRKRRTRSRASTPPPPRQGVLENIANIFARNTPAMPSPPHSRRASIASRTSRTRLLRRHSSRRSEASSDYAVESDEEEEGDSRWGYSSGEEDESEGEEDLEELRAMASDSDLDFGSYPPSPSGGTNLPLLAGDDIFGGETRLEIGDFEMLDPPPPGPPSRQIIHLTDEDADIRIVGFEIIAWRRWAWRTCCVLTCGIFALLGHWFPRLWLRWVAREKAFKDAHDGFVVVEVRTMAAGPCAHTDGSKTVYRDIALMPLQTLDYPYELSTVFSTLADPSARPPLSRLPSRSQVQNGNGDVSQKLGTLVVVDYRYTKFALDPRTGLFSAVKCVSLYVSIECIVHREGNDRDWRDPSWTGISWVQHGLVSDVQKQRHTLFGSNAIVIDGKSTIGLLVDEV